MAAIGPPLPTCALPKVNRLAGVLRTCHSCDWHQAFVTHCGSWALKNAVMQKHGIFTLERISINGRIPSTVVAGLVPTTSMATALGLHTLLHRCASTIEVAGTSPATTAQRFFKSTGNRFNSQSCCSRSDRAPGPGRTCCVAPSLVWRTWLLAFSSHTQLRMRRPGVVTLT
jgi:hypothetical protein